MAEPKRKRRRWQFSLKAILYATLLVAAFFAGYAYRGGEVDRTDRWRISSQIWEQRTRSITKQARVRGWDLEFANDTGAIEAFGPFAETTAEWRETPEGKRWKPYIDRAVQK